MIRRNVKHDGWRGWLSLFPSIFPFCSSLSSSTRGTFPLSVSLSLCSTGRLSRTKGGLDLPKSNVEYFRRYLNSASKGGRRKERMRRREGRNRSTRVTNVASLTLILRSNYILSVRRRTEESVVATFPRHRTLPLLPKNLFSFPRFPSSSRRFLLRFLL